MSEVVRAEFRIVLTVDGRDYECETCTVNYALNQVPSAVCAVAVGQDVRTLSRAAAHEFSPGQHILPAYITLRGNGDWRSPGDKRWTRAGEQVIFRGYLTGLPRGVRRGQASYRFQLLHWLSDLSFSSLLSRQSHATNPLRFRWRSVLPSVGSTAGVRTNAVTDYVSSGLFTATNIVADLWGNALFPFFCELSGNQVLDFTSVDGCAAAENGDETGNTELKQALGRLETSLSSKDNFSTDCGNGGAASPYFKSLSMAQDGITDTIGDSIGRYCRKQTEREIYGNTAWSKLVGDFGPRFFFTVVPRVETAIIAPFAPGYRETIDQEFGGGLISDPTYIGSTGSLSRPLKAVGVPRSGPASLAGGLGDAYRQVSDRVLGGCFSPGPSTGMILFRQPPAWLQNVPMQPSDVSKTVLNDNALIVGSATTPRDPSTSSISESTPEAAVEDSQNYYTRIARYYYISEMLRGRSGVVYSKPRFDIAPGSNIRVPTQNALLIDGDSDNGDIIGQVSQVATTFDATAKTASSAFSLVNVRNSRENADDRTSAPGHPLYATNFAGAPLQHELFFADA